MKSTLMKIYGLSLILGLGCAGISAVMASQIDDAKMHEVSRRIGQVVGAPHELKPVEETLEVGEAFDGIEVNGQNGFIKVTASHDEKARVKFTGRVSEEKSDARYGYKVEGSKLKITATPGTESWSSSFGWNANGKTIHFSQARLDTELFLPPAWKGRLIIKGINGDIDVKLPSLESAELNTVSGDIEIQGAIAQSLKAETVSGDLEVKLSPARSYKVSASTVSGEIKNELPPNGSASGTPITLKTVSGDIEISNE